MRVLAMVVAGCMLLAACNTVQGVGQDVQDAGEALEKGAKKTKEAITN
ncbi:MAG: entericidin A/B family lipoprotein [Pseudomonadota bacterium]